MMAEREIIPRLGLDTNHRTSTYPPKRGFIGMEIRTSDDRPARGSFFFPLPGHRTSSLSGN